MSWKIRNGGEFVEVEFIEFDKLDVQALRRLELKFQCGGWEIDVFLVKIRSWEVEKQLCGLGGEGGFGEIVLGYVVFQVVVDS